MEKVERRMEASLQGFCALSEAVHHFKEACDMQKMYITQPSKH